MLSGFLAVATKYAETYIVLKYRKKDRNGKYYGGAMYVLKERLGSNRLAIVFSILVIITSFGIGALIQSNSSANSMLQITNVDIRIIAIVITIICSYILIGNSKKIAKASSILVPIATLIYILMCIFILFEFKTNFLASINNIVKEALNFKAFISGTGTMYILNMISIGLSKGMFSNEAGIGSSPMFDVTSSKKNIEEQSLIASLCVFIDTVLMCTLTGITICVTLEYLNISEPIILIDYVFSKIPNGNIFLAISLSIFAIATIPCWSYYGEVAVNFIFKNKKIYVVLYKTFYIISIYVGCISNLNTIWSISSIANALMCLPNIYMIIVLNKEILFKSSHKIFTKMK